MTPSVIVGRIVSGIESKRLVGLAETCSTNGLHFESAQIFNTVAYHTDGDFQQKARLRQRCLDALKHAPKDSHPTLPALEVGEYKGEGIWQFMFALTGLAAHRHIALAIGVGRPRTQFDCTSSDIQGRGETSSTQPTTAGHGTFSVR